MSTGDKGGVVRSASSERQTAADHQYFEGYRAGERGIRALTAERDQLRANNERLTKELAEANECTEFYAKESDAHCNEREKLRADLADLQNDIMGLGSRVMHLERDLARSQAALEAQRPVIEAVVLLYLADQKAQTAFSHDEHVAGQNRWEQAVRHLLAISAALAAARPGHDDADG